MSEGAREIIDDKGRRVRITRSPEGSVTEIFYIGRDCEGVVKLEEGMEYVETDGQKRYWGGIIDPLPNDRRIRQLNNFTVFVVKPDGMKLELGKAIRHLITVSKGNIVAERDFIYDDAMIRRMYPHFFAKEWEKDLFDYLKSGHSRCLLIRGDNPHGDMINLRNSIRQLFGCYGGKVVSLVHCAKQQDEAIKQALLFFRLEEIVTHVGLKHK